MASQLPEPHDPPSPDDSPPRRPTGTIPIYPPGRSWAPVTAAEQARPLPIAYGTVKLPVLLVEKFPVVPPDTAAWAAGTFVQGAIVLNSGNAYECIVGGTSVTGPSGTATDFTDGGTAHWKFRQQVAGDPPQWLANTLTVVGYMVRNGGNVYEAISAYGTTAASGGPVGTAGSITDNTVVWRYVQQLPCPIFMQRFLGALCEGEVTAGVSLWWDHESFVAVDSGNKFLRNLELKKGVDAANQTILGIFDSSGYQHTALLQPFASGVGMPTGTKSELPDLAVELQAVMLGASTADVNPGDIINDLLTHARRGCVWPGSRVDTTITGTGAGSYRVYCDAAGFRFSMVLDAQRPAKDWIADILVATNSEAVWSGGKLKVVPLGDQGIASPVYGATAYVSPNAVQYNLAAGDFLRASWTRRKDPDCFNTWPVEYVNRAAGYVSMIEERPDAANVEKIGGKTSSPSVALPVIFPDGTQPIMLSGILTQRSLYNRNTYRIEGVPWTKVLTEPTDVITVTDPVSGLSLQPMRIIEWEEGEDGETISLTCEDYGTAVQAIASFTPQAPTAAFKANQPGTTATMSTQTPAGTLSHKNFDNLWPNANSELGAPSGADATLPEWAGRVLDAGAYAGTWVRQLSAASGQRQILGDLRGVNAVTSLSQLALVFPCSPGEAFYLEAFARFLAGTAVATTASVAISFWDASFTNLLNSLNTSITAPGAGFPTAWTKVNSASSLTAPAGAVWVRFELNANSASGAVTAQFDAIYARRQVDQSTLVDGSVGTSKIVDASVTRAKQAAVGQQVSSGSGAFSTTSTTYVDLTNCSVTMTTTGRPVILFVQPGGGVADWNQTQTTQDTKFALLRDGSIIAEWKSDTIASRPLGVANLKFLDTAASAASHTWKIQVLTTNAVNVVSINNWALVAYEL